MSNYVPLDEAARILGISPDQLVEMRSQGRLRGFRDGASWKFPQDEIDRLKEEGLAGGSDIGLGGDPGGSDVALVARQGEGDGSDVEVVASGSGLEIMADGDDDEFKLAPEDASGAIDIGGEPADGSTGPSLGSDLQISEGSGVDVLGDMDVAGAEKGGTGDLIRGDSDPDLALGDVDDALSDDDDLVIADDDDDLVLAGGGSDISIAGDSGINLMSPSDSGLSLENEPLDLAGSSISALDLGEDAGDSPSSGGEGSGSLVDFKADEDFQLSPSGVGLEADDDDSGSQVIEVEDSAAFVDDVGFDAEPVEEGVGAFDEGGWQEGDGGLVEDTEGVEMGADDQMGLQPAMGGGGAGVPVMAQGEPFGLWSVLFLAATLLIMCLAGMVVTDLMRNLWAYETPAAPVSSLTDALIDMFGLK